MIATRLIFMMLAAYVAGAVVTPGARATQSKPIAAASAVRGAQLFLQCRACHTVVAGGAHTVGPNLSGIVGARAATRTGYSYSPALTKSGIIWTALSLDGFMKRPMQAVPGTKMAFAGVADAKARADIIAYLANLKGSR